MDSVFSYEGGNVSRRKFNPVPVKRPRVERRPVEDLMGDPPVKVDAKKRLLAWIRVQANER